MGMKNLSIAQLRKHCLTLDKPVIGLAINWIPMGRGGLPIVRDNAVAWITAHGLRVSIYINNNGSK
jgi:hypothetical protein